MKTRIALILLMLICATAYGGAGTSLVPRRAANKQGPKIPPNTPVISVILKFQEGTHVRLRGGHLVTLPRDAREDARLALLGLTGAEVDHDAQAVEALIASSRLVRGFGRLFTIDEDALATRRANGEARSGVELADLNLYYRALLAAKATRADVDSLVDALNALPSVEIAYAEAPPRFPQAATPDLQSYEGHLNAAPNGINAFYAWGVAGGKGQGISIVDVEGAWNLSHEDLPIAPQLFYQGGTAVNDPADRTHGTSVLGVMVAVDNGFGVTGIANQARIGTQSILDGSTANEANAITNASIAAGMGGVVVLELQETGPAPTIPCTCQVSQCGNVPAEYLQDRYDAIATATATGSIVVEAAGNGSSNLDDPEYQGLFNRSVRDSGAILVGAGSAFDRTPQCFTNYGSRVDVQGWGGNVVTTGGGDLYGNELSENQQYTATFGGTSSATAMVAGASASILGASYASGQYLGFRSSRDIRKILSDTGTAQGSSSEWIGPLPDLAAAIPRVLDLPPSAAFTVNCTDLVCNADASASSDDNGSLTYDWRWGDNSGSSGGPLTSHTYATYGSYTVILTVTDSVGQTAVTSQTIDVHAPPTTPGSFSATAASTTTVTLTWQASSGSAAIDHYAVQRQTSLNGAWSPEITTTQTSFTDTGLAAATTYRYRVKAVDTLGSSSAYALDYATTVIFGAPLQRYVSVIAAADVRDLRAAVDAWRRFAGASTVYSANLTPAGVIKAANFITDTSSDPLPGVVTALNEARTALGLAAFAYSGVPAPARGNFVYVEHVQQLRDIMK